MRKFNPTIIILGVISMVELIATKSMGYSLLLWIAYGIYKAISD